MDNSQTNAAPGQSAAAGANTGVTQTDAASEKENTGSATREAPVQAADLQAEFEALIKGKYKQAYDARMQDTIARRLKHARQQQERLDAAEPLLQHLAQQHGVAADDLEGLSRAVMGTQEEAPSQEAGKLYDTWLRQEQQTKELYPAFSMQEALGDPRFQALLRGGADVRTAYEAANLERIIPAAMAVTAKVVAGRIARGIASTAARPDENAMGSRAAALVRPDVSKFSKSDMDEVARRVARGERVSFG